MGVSAKNGGTPISHPKIRLFLVGKPMVVGETHHFRKPPKSPLKSHHFTFPSFPDPGFKVKIRLLKEAKMLQVHEEILSEIARESSSTQILPSELFGWFKYV